jgi:uncharacterized protein YgiM (DUF1202 family)
MKVKVFIYTLAIYFCGQATHNSIYAEALYVKSSNTKLYEKNSPSSKVTLLLPEGTEVQNLKKSKNFINVSLSTGEKGWIFKYKLTNSPPNNSSSLSKDKRIFPLDINQDFAVRESSSGSSIRAKENKDKASMGLDDLKKPKENPDRKKNK